jgi:transposase
VRVCTAFNKMLGIPGASVAGVSFGPEGVVVALRRRRAKLTCPCGWRTWAVYDRHTRRWRHLDLGTSRCYLEAEIRRLECRACRRVRTEVVPWARPGARHSKDLQDVVAWLAQRLDKTSVSRLLRVSWEAVAHIVTAVVAEHIDDARLNDLYRIGVDEVSYRKGHRYLTVVANHDRDGAVVWAGDGKGAAALDAFYDELGPDRAERLVAVSMDLGAGYRYSTTNNAPQAAQPADPFHIVQLANKAVDEVRRRIWNQIRRAKRAEKGPLGPDNYYFGSPALSFQRNTRWVLLKDPSRLSPDEVATIAGLRRSRRALWRAWELKEGLRDLYRLPRGVTPGEHLDAWLASACRCRIPEIVKLSKTIRWHRADVIAAVELGLSNSKLEGLNSKIRLINHRGYGHHSAAAVIAMVYLCCGGITVELPTGS